MKTTKVLALTAISTALSLSAISLAPTPVQAKEMEKCYGVVKAGHNDCANAAGTHSCAGHATTDGDAGEWLLLPKGTCDKLVGGSTEPKAKN